MPKVLSIKDALRNPDIAGVFSTYSPEEQQEIRKNKLYVQWDDGTEDFVNDPGMGMSAWNAFKTDAPASVGAAAAASVVGPMAAAKFAALPAAAITTGGALAGGFAVGKAFDKLVRDPAAAEELALQNAIADEYYPKSAAVGRLAADALGGGLANTRTIGRHLLGKGAISPEVARKIGIEMGVMGGASAGLGEAGKIVGAAMDPRVDYDFDPAYTAGNALGGAMFSSPRRPFRAIQRGVASRIKTASSDPAVQARMQAIVDNPGAVAPAEPEELTGNTGLASAMRIMAGKGKPITPEMVRGALEQPEFRHYKQAFEDTPEGLANFMEAELNIPKLQTVQDRLMTLGLPGAKSSPLYKRIDNFLKLGYTPEEAVAELSKGLDPDALRGYNSALSRYKTPEGEFDNNNIIPYIEQLRDLVQQGKATAMGPVDKNIIKALTAKNAKNVGLDNAQIVEYLKSPNQETLNRLMAQNIGAHRLAGEMQESGSDAASMVIDGIAAGVDPISSRQARIAKLATVGVTDPEKVSNFASMSDTQFAFEVRKLELMQAAAKAKEKAAAANTRTSEVDETAISGNVDEATPAPQPAASPGEPPPSTPPADPTAPQAKPTPQPFTAPPVARPAITRVEEEIARQAAEAQKGRINSGDVVQDKTGNVGTVVSTTPQELTVQDPTGKLSSLPASEPVEITGRAPVDPVVQQAVDVSTPKPPPAAQTTASPDVPPWKRPIKIDPEALKAFFAWQLKGIPTERMNRQVNEILQSGTFSRESELALLAARDGILESTPPTSKFTPPTKPQPAPTKPEPVGTATTPPVPQPENVILAQVADMFDPKTPREAVLVTPGTKVPSELEAMAKAGRVVRVSTRHGSVYYAGPPAKNMLEKIRSAARGNVFEGSILGMTDTPPPTKGTASGKVVVTKDRAGVPVQEQATKTGNTANVVKQTKAQNPGKTVVVESDEEVKKRRAAQLPKAQSGPEVGTQTPVADFKDELNKLRDMKSRQGVSPVGAIEEEARQTAKVIQAGWKAVGVAYDKTVGRVLNSTVDKAEIVAGPIVRKLNDALELDYLINYNDSARFYKNAEKRLAPEDWKTLRQYADWMEKGLNPQPLPERIQKAWTDIIGGLNAIRDKQDAAGLKIAGRLPGRDPFFLPGSVKRKVWDIIHNPKHVDYEKYKAHFTNHLKNQGRSAEQIAEQWEALRIPPGEGGTTVESLGAYGPVRKPEGVDLPVEWMEDLKTSLYAHLRRSAFDISKYKNIESNPEAMKIFGNVPDTLASHPHIQDMLQSWYGRYLAPSDWADQVNSMVTSGVLGVETTIRDTANGLFLPLEYGEYLLPLRGVLRAMKMGKRDSSGLTEAQRGGAVPLHDASLVHMTQVGDTTTEKVMAVVGKAFRTLQGRELAEVMNRHYAAAIGDVLVETITPKRMSEILGYDVTGLSPDRLRLLMRQRAVRDIQGGYGPDGLPTWLSRGLNKGDTLRPAFKAMFSIARWGFERTNNFRRNVLKPMQRGNFKPFIGSLLGLGAGNAVVSWIWENIKKETPPTYDWKELGRETENYFKHGEANLTQMEIAFNISQKARAMGYGGIMSYFLETGLRSQYGQTPTTAPIGLAKFEQFFKRFGQAKSEMDGKGVVEAVQELGWQLLKDNLQGIPNENATDEKRLERSYNRMTGNVNVGVEYNPFTSAARVRKMTDPRKIADEWWRLVETQGSAPRTVGATIKDYMPTTGFVEFHQRMRGPEKTEEMLNTKLREAMKLPAAKQLMDEDFRRMSPLEQERLKRIIEQNAIARRRFLPGQPVPSGSQLPER